MDVGSGASVPVSRDVALSVMEPYLADLAGVLLDAWGDFVAARDQAGFALARVGGAARGMVVADLMTAPVHQRFGNRTGVEVQSRMNQPWLRVRGASAMVDVRFRKLDSSFAICSSDSDRSQALSFHLPDPALPGMPETTVLTAGYVLDLAGRTIEAMALVCHVGRALHYVLDLPHGRGVVGTPTQLPLAPLPEPVIRSAMNGARLRIGHRVSGGADG
jgi:hypothetical protein